MIGWTGSSASLFISNVFVMSSAYDIDVGMMKPVCSASIGDLGM